MQIQFYTDTNVTKSKDLVAWSTSLISKELSRFSRHKAKVEVRLLDEESSNNGVHDKCCIVEARLAGRKPIAVTEHANTHVQAIFGAIYKLKTSLENNNRTFKSLFR